MSKLKVEFVEGQFDDVEEEDGEENVEQILSEIMFSKLSTKYEIANKEFTGKFSLKNHGFLLYSKKYTSFLQNIDFY